jgi:cytosine deaminase
VNDSAIRQALDVAIEEAEASWEAGGIPIGSSLLDAHGSVIASGSNRRVQDGDPTAHAEMVCIRNAGRRRDLATTTLVSTLSPCSMCAGTAVLYRIPLVVIGEHRTFMGAEDWMRANGIELTVLDDPRCVALMERLQRERPELWAEDIGLEEGTEGQRD